MLKPKKFPRVVNTKRLMIRALSPQHADELFNLVDTHRQTFRKFLTMVDKLRTRQMTTTFVTKAQLFWHQHRSFNYAIFDPKTKNLIGGFIVHNLVWAHETCELGYWMSPETEGHGYMTEVVQHFCKLCFELGFHRIEIRCSSSNIKSSAVALRTRFQYEGLLRDNLILNNKRQSTAIYALVSRSKIKR